MCKIAGVKAVCRYLSGESGANLVVAETYGLAGVGDDQSFRDLTRQTHAPGPVRTTVFRGRKVRVADHSSTCGVLSVGVGHGKHGKGTLPAVEHECCPVPSDTVKPGRPRREVTEDPEFGVPLLE